MDFTSKFPPQNYYDTESLKQEYSALQADSELTCHGFLSSEGCEQFCHSENFSECASYLSQELKFLGFLPLFDEDTSRLNLVKVINSLHHLLQLNKGNVRLRSEYHKKIVMANGEINSLRSTKSQLNNRIDSFERTIASMQEKERQLMEKFKAAAAKLKLEKEENRKLQAIIQQRDSQYNHELRKKERECDKLKDRINRQLIVKAPLKGQGIELSEQLSRPSGQRGKWKTPENNAKDTENFHKNVICQFQARIQMLLDENVSLRESLFSVQNMINESLAYQCDTNSDNSSSELESASSLPKEIFNLPCDLICPKIKKFVKKKLLRLRSLTVSNTKSETELPSDNFTNEDDECVSEVRNEFPNSGNNLNEKYLRSTAASEFVPVNNSKHLPVDPDEELHLQKKKKMFEHQVETFEKEREIYTNAAIKLSRERIAFDQEKAKFNQRTFLEMDVPKLLPEDLIKRRNIKISAFGDSSDLPSTPELLKAMKMSPRNLNRSSLYTRTNLFRVDQNLSNSCHDLGSKNGNADYSTGSLHKSLSHGYMSF